MNTLCCWLAGWEFVLRRCIQAVGMDVNIVGDTDDVSQAWQLMNGIRFGSTRLPSTQPALPSHPSRSCALANSLRLHAIAIRSLPHTWR